MSISAFSAQQWQVSRDWSCDATVHASPRRALRVPAVSMETDRRPRSWINDFKWLHEEPLGPASAPFLAALFGVAALESDLPLSASVLRMSSARRVPSNTKASSACAKEYQKACETDQSRRELPIEPLGCQKASCRCFPVSSTSAESAGRCLAVDLPCSWY